MCYLPTYLPTLRTLRTCSNFLLDSLIGQTRAQFILGETYVEELRLAAANTAADDGASENVPGTGPNAGGGGCGGGGDACAADPVTGYKNGTRVSLDPRAMGIATTACGGHLSAGASGGRVGGGVGRSVGRSVGIQGQPCLLACASGGRTKWYYLA